MSKFYAQTPAGSLFGTNNKLKFQKRCLKGSIELTRERNYKKLLTLKSKELFQHLQFRREKGNYIWFLKTKILVKKNILKLRILLPPPNCHFKVREFFNIYNLAEKIFDLRKLILVEKWILGLKKKKKFSPPKTLISNWQNF